MRDGAWHVVGNPLDRRARLEDHATNELVVRPAVRGVDELLHDCRIVEAALKPPFFGVRRVKDPAPATAIVHAFEFLQGDNRKALLHGVVHGQGARHAEACHANVAVVCFCNLVIRGKLGLDVPTPVDALGKSRFFCCACYTGGRHTYQGGCAGGNAGLGQEIPTRQFHVSSLCHGLLRLAHIRTALPCWPAPEQAES